MNPSCVLMCKTRNNLQGHISQCKHCSSLSDMITGHFDFLIFAYFYMIMFHIISMCYFLKVFLIEVKFTFSERHRSYNLMSFGKRTHSYGPSNI